MNNESGLNNHGIESMVGHALRREKECVGRRAMMTGVQWRRRKCRPKRRLIIIIIVIIII